VGAADATLLRYRFDDVEQLQQHLHVVEGRGVFFFRDPKLSLASGNRIVLEILLDNTQQQSVLRGQVLARDEGGLWLEFPDARLARRVAERALTKRKHLRIPTDDLVQVRGALGAQIGRMLDISLSGARMTGLSLSAQAGSPVEMRLMAPPEGVPADAWRGAIIRNHPGDLAVRFNRDDPTTRLVVARLQESVQEAWQQARELSHPPICCGAGGVLEPPLPHISASRR